MKKIIYNFTSKLAQSDIDFIVRELNKHPMIECEQNNFESISIQIPKEVSDDNILFLGTTIGRMELNAEMALLSLCN